MPRLTRALPRRVREAPRAPSRRHGSATFARRARIPQHCRSPSPRARPYTRACACAARTRDRTQPHRPPAMRQCRRQACADRREAGAGDSLCHDVPLRGMDTCRPTCVRMPRRGGCRKRCETSRFRCRAIAVVGTPRRALRSPRGVLGGQGRTSQLATRLFDSGSRFRRSIVACTSP